MLPEEAPRESLVQYENAVEKGIDANTAQGFSTGKKSELPPMDSKPATKDILNSILPPQEWLEDSRLMVRYVSPSPASRVDVARLRELLDTKLMERQA